MYGTAADIESIYHVLLNKKRTPAQFARDHPAAHILANDRGCADIRLAPARCTTFWHLTSPEFAASLRVVVLAVLSNRESLHRGGIMSASSIPVDLYEPRRATLQICAVSWW